MSPLLPSPTGESSTFSREQVQERRRQRIKITAAWGMIIAALIAAVASIVTTWMQNDRIADLKGTLEGQRQEIASLAAEIRQHALNADKATADTKVPPRDARPDALPSPTNS